MPKFDPSTSAASRMLVPIAAGAALLLGACTTYVQEPAPAYVQGPPPAPAYYPETPPPPPAANPLDQLMAPVALYPDPLISLILPASTFPSDIAAAGSYLSGGGDAGQVDTQPWEPSVRSLAHYPDVVTWMAANGSWTQTVGAAFVSQPAEVMKAIQRLRELARAAGTLTSTPQQQVIVETGFVEIEPAQPDVIYVPRYDPEVVFVDQPYYGYNGPFFTYGPAYSAGIWLTFGCNWHGGGVVIVDEGYWHRDGGWWHPYGPGPGHEFAAYPNSRPWGFPPDRPRPEAVHGWQRQAQVIHPQLAAGAPRQPPQSAYRNIHTRGPAAVAVVARNPAAFKGKPLNSAIIARPSGTPAQRSAPASPKAAAHPQTPAKPQGQAYSQSSPRPQPAVRPQTPAPSPTKPAPAPLVRDESVERNAAVRPAGEGAPPARVEETEKDRQGGPVDPKKVKKVPPKPAPKEKEEERPKQEENPH